MNAAPRSEKGDTRVTSARKSGGDGDIREDRSFERVYT